MFAVDALSADFDPGKVSGDRQNHSLGTYWCIQTPACDLWTRLNSFSKHSKGLAVEVGELGGTLRLTSASVNEIIQDKLRSFLCAVA